MKNYKLSTLILLNFIKSIMLKFIFFIIIKIIMKISEYSCRIIVQNLQYKEKIKISTLANKISVKIYFKHNIYQFLKTLEGHTRSVHSLIQLRDGNLASASYDTTI